MPRKPAANACLTSDSVRSSFQAVPYISTYAATKAFDLLFAEGLAEEMKPYGIRVCALCPGSTESEFHAVSEQEKFQRRVETAEKVAHTGLKALAAGKTFASVEDLLLEIYKQS